MRPRRLDAADLLGHDGGDEIDGPGPLVLDLEETADTMLEELVTSSNERIGEVVGFAQALVVGDHRGVRGHRVDADGSGVHLDRSTIGGWFFSRAVP